MARGRQLRAVHPRSPREREAAVAGQTLRGPRLVRVDEHYANSRLYLEADPRRGDGRLVVLADWRADGTGYDFLKYVTATGELALMSTEHQKIAVVARVDLPDAEVAKAVASSLAEHNPRDIEEVRYWVLELAEEPHFQRASPRDCSRR